MSKLIALSSSTALLIALAGCDSSSGNQGDNGSPKGGSSTGGTAAGGSGGQGGTSSGGAGATNGGTGGSNAVGGTAGTNAVGGSAGTNAVGGTAGSGGAAGAGVTGGSAGAVNTGGGGAAGASGAAGSGGTSGAGGGAGTSGTGGSGGGAPTRDPMVYVGGYDPNVRAYQLNRMTGELTASGSPVNMGTNPAYLAVNPARTHLYAANESDGAQGGVTAASIGAQGALTALGRQGADNLGFVHVAVSPNGKFAVAASYNGGAVAVFPINSNGALAAAVDTERFNGGGVQSHCVAFDSAGTHVFVPNKGLNNVAQFNFDAMSGALTANSPATVAAPSNSGPRHIALHPNGRFAYVMNELSSSMSAYSVSTNGTLTLLDTKSALPSGFSGTNTGAHVEVSPDGTLLFGSNRGHNSIVVFSLDPNTGAMTLLEHESTRGETPRDFDVDPAGKYLVVANQGSNNLTVYGIAANGLTPVGSAVTGPMGPAAVQFVYLP